MLLNLSEDAAGQDDAAPTRRGLWRREERRLAASLGELSCDAHGRGWRYHRACPWCGSLGRSSTLMMSLSRVQDSVMAADQHEFRYEEQVR